MSKIKFKYFGERKNKHGVEKSYDKDSLSKRKLKRLEDKGWVKVVEKPKPKKKTKLKSKEI